MNVEVNRPIFLPRSNPETFLIEEIAEAPPPQGQRPKRKEFFFSAPLGQHHAGLIDDETRFGLAYAVLRAGEREQRKAIRRKIAKRTRNIDLNVSRTIDYLAPALASGKRPSKGVAVETDQVADLMKEALAPVRAVLGFGSGCPGEFSYRITEGVLASTRNDALRRKLRARIPLGDLFAPGLAAIKELLEVEFPEEAAFVYSALEATRSREHVSAISVQSSGEELWVTIVNAGGGVLTLEAHKFVGLLEASGKSRRLHEITWQDARNPEIHFVFNNQTEGEVIGRFDPHSGCLHVACCLEKGKSTACRTRFILDLDYLLCLYLVLKRLRADRERFARLLEVADATPAIDPFEAFTTY